MLTLNKLRKPMCFFISEAEYFPRISVKKKRMVLKKKKKWPCQFFASKSLT